MKPHNFLKKGATKNAVYGRLTLVKELTAFKFPSGQTQRYFLCRCDCGKEVKVLLSNLRTGNTKSCGCKWVEAINKHGETKHPLYKVWSSMKDRCDNPNSRSFKNYGGRGIKVCERWYEFTNFFEDISLKWKKGLSLDRIDNDGDYSLLNVKLSTSKEQSQNRREKVFTHPFFKNKIHDPDNIQRVLQREVREGEIRASATVDKGTH